MARVLGACRESGKGEESISITNQKKRISQWAEDHGHTVARFTVDKDTSGGVPAVRRDDLGSWLTVPDKIGQWDILATAKLDRGFRSVLDFAQTQEWADKRGKKLVSVSEGYDLTTPEGELMAMQLVAFAQFERKRGGVRRAEAAELISESGRWGGGRKPFGYKAAGTRGNYRLVKDEDNVALVLRMAREVLGGKGFLTVAGEFNAEGIPSPWGKTWTGFTVKRILSSPALIGFMTKTIEHRDTVLYRDSSGKPVKFTDDPILAEDEWRKLQDAIRARARKRDMPQARLLLYRAAYCGYCSPPWSENAQDCICKNARPCEDHDIPLRGYRRVKHASKGNRYFCRGCGYGIALRKLEGWVADSVMNEYGRRKLLEHATIAGDDWTTEIIRLQRKIGRLKDELDDDYDEDLKKVIATTEARIEELRNRPRKEDRKVWVPVVPEITVAGYWDAGDDKDRNRLLRDYGFIWWATREGIKGRGAWVPADEEVFELRP